MSLRQKKSKKVFFRDCDLSSIKNFTLTLSLHGKNV